MKVFLLDPEDAFAQSYSAEQWDLVVDLGRAPAGTYERWSRQTECPVVSIYDYAEEIADLYRLQELLHLGTGPMADQWGIDWWDVLSLEIAPQLHQLMLAHRLAKQLGARCHLYSSRPNPLATALCRILGVRLTILESRFQSVIRRARHYQSVLSSLDTNQLAQVVEDKFDTDCSIRRHFTHRSPSSRQPVILLPSAYINVSRIALSYAEILPDHQFLLVNTRSNGKVPSLPPNVREATLAPYFVPNNKRETASLLESWNDSRKQLVGSTEEFNTADATGLLGRIPRLLHWGIGLRNAWNQVFESENVTACLSADDSNPPSNIPLIIAKKRGLPALACHHGALDYMMAIKVHHADLYLVKNRMEEDYLRRICQLAPEKIVIAAPASSKPLPSQAVATGSAPWLVFFTEPYQTSGWRSDEVYRELLPPLCSLAQDCGLRLVFKLHPFESIKGHRRMLRRLMPDQERKIDVIAGPPSDRLWNNVRFALTVQSSTALECAALGIPVFLCAWLGDSYSGYVQQYARFGAGHVLQSSEQLAEIPALLENRHRKFFNPQATRKAIDSAKLADLFSGAYALPVASNA